MRDQLAVQDGVDGESRRLGRELDLLRAEVEVRLDVRARDGKDVSSCELAGNRPVHVAGDDPAHLPMRPDNAAECRSIGRRKADLVKCRHPGDKRRVMQRQERRNVRGRCERRLQPVQPVRVELAAILARPRAVERDSRSAPRSTAYCTG